MILSPKEESVISLIEEDDVYENYFFKKVSDVKWFYRLKEKGYFNPEKAPGLKSSEQEGYYLIPEWNILPYLEKISKLKDLDQEYISELLIIILNVTDYHIKNNKCLDNYRTWWYFIKILSNIPNEKISNEVIDLIPTWLYSRFESGLPGSEILKKLLPKFLDGNNPKDLGIAERIIDSITQIKWVPKYTGQRKEELIKERTKILDKN